ncbi:hypothetical protein CPC08DRAFT_731614 [Agrocybe pediades]|nr:hypothetical protein CPC08DRAFT_731614 [Agrocybe pediades]
MADNTVTLELSMRDYQRLQTCMTNEATRDMEEVFKHAEWILGCHLDEQECAERFVAFARALKSAARTCSALNAVQIQVCFEEHQVYFLRSTINVAVYCPRFQLVSNTIIEDAFSRVLKLVNEDQRRVFELPEWFWDAIFDGDEHRRFINVDGSSDKEGDEMPGLETDSEDDD